MLQSSPKQSIRSQSCSQVNPLSNWWTDPPYKIRLFRSQSCSQVNPLSNVSRQKCYNLLLLVSILFTGKSSFKRTPHSDSPTSHFRHPFPRASLQKSLSRQSNRAV